MGTRAIKNNTSTRMKNLNYYTNEATTKALDEAGAFFAFSNEQFREQKKEGAVYVSGGSGMYCLAHSYHGLLETLSQITVDGIARDKEENGIDGIINRELANHEVGYTNDITDTVEALTAYGITHEQVQNYYNANRDKFYD